MYDLGEQFKVDYTKGIADKSYVFQGQNYRITILSEQLIRLEFSQEGKFEDRPTELVWNRRFSKPNFQVNEDQFLLEISTTNFKLSYVKGKHFDGGKFNPTKNLKIFLNGTDKVWYFNHPEIRNYGASDAMEENTSGKIKFTKGLYSIDGFVSIDDTKSNILLENGQTEARNTNSIDTYVFLYGRDFAACLRDYYTLTGYPALLPRYALGTWWSKNTAYDDASLKKLIDDFVDNDIPLSVLLLDKDWHKRVMEGNNHLKTGFTFDNDYFKAPAEMIKYLHAKGIRLGLNINPTEGIYPIEENYDKMAQYLPPNEKGVIPFNVYDPKFVDAYLKILIHPLDNLGVDFYFIDYNSDSEILNQLKYYHSFDMKRDNVRRPMMLGYNSSLAPHRYPVLYSGKTVVSWETLKKIPIHNLNAANIGVSWWAHDIGGYFKGIEDEELYTRFLELGTFSPIMKFGSDSCKYYKREPWRWEIKTNTIAKKYLTLRNQMIPYLYSEAFKYHKNGTPIIQPLYYKIPELYDDVLYHDEYYLGSEFFISPIIDKKEQIINRTIHKFYIPDGTWYNFLTGKKFPGGKSYVSFFKEEDYPCFVKAGGIVPLGYNDNINDITPPKNMDIHIFPGHNNTYILHEDDGVSSLYTKGYYLTTSIDYNYLPNNYTVIIRAIDGKSKIAPDTRNYKIIFRNTKKANEVIAYFDKEEIEVESYVDGPDFIVEAKDIKTTGQLTINCKGKDIEIDALRLLSDDLQSIISDLPIDTEMKEKVDEIFFSDMDIRKKRIAIRKLKGKRLESKFVSLFLKLLEYMGQV